MNKYTYIYLARYMMFGYMMALKIRFNLKKNINIVLLWKVIYNKYKILESQNTRRSVYLIISIRYKEIQMEFIFTSDFYSPKNWKYFLTWSGYSALLNNLSTCRIKLYQKLPRKPNFNSGRESKKVYALKNCKTFYIRYENDVKSVLTLQFSCRVDFLILPLNRKLTVGSYKYI